MWVKCQPSHITGRTLEKTAMHYKNNTTHFCIPDIKEAAINYKYMILQLSTILIFAFGIVPTVWYFLLVILFYPHNLILFMIFVSLPVFAMNTRRTLEKTAMHYKNNTTHFCIPDIKEAAINYKYMHLI
jgi:predicted AlkP superfamily phosphohydrolase/phosphomutase